MRAPDFDLYLVTDRNRTRGRGLLEVLERALKGGVRAVQLREKDLGGGELFSLAEKVLDLCRSHGAALLVNDRIDVARAVDADGVHLGQASVPVAVARELLGDGKLIGASTHSVEEARDAERSGADFVLFGPVYYTPSKAAYGRPQGPAALKEVVEKISLPVYAIGGIRDENLPEVKKAGVRGVALISAVMSAGDPEAAAKRLITILRR